MNGGRPLRIGIVGAGRRRNGLGPFVARAFERAGGRVVAVAGRDADRAVENATELAAQLGHAVAAAADLPSLCAGIDALAIASPQEQHLPALRAALAARVPCLCEKPLVGVDQIDAGLQVVQGFTTAGVLLTENCQWPFVLPAVTALHGAAPGPVCRVAMGLSPIGVGSGPMVRDALPHLLSVAQAVVPNGGSLALAGADLEGRGAGSLRCAVHLELGHADGSLAATLELAHCADQPRPAWLSVDGRRIDRRIGADYAIAFAAGGRTFAVDDPLQQLVATFVHALTHPGPDRAGAGIVAARLRAYAAVLRAVGATGD